MSRPAAVVVATGAVAEAVVATGAVDGAAGMNPKRHCLASSSLGSATQGHLRSLAPLAGLGGSNLPRSVAGIFPS